MTAAQFVLYRFGEGEFSITGWGIIITLMVAGALSVVVHNR